jgi:hypothetical protein
MNPIRPKKTELTAKERRYALMFCIGYSHHEIGMAMGVSQDRGRTAIRDIKSFWFGGAASRREFYARAMREGIVGTLDPYRWKNASTADWTLQSRFKSNECFFYNPNELNP